MIKQTTTAQKLDIYINSSRVNECFNRRGANENENKQIEELNKSLQILKKKGAVKPVFTMIKPKKPLETDNSTVKATYAKAEEEYKEKKAEFDNLMKNYDKFSSEEYKRSNLAYKLSNKLTKLAGLLEKEELESRKKEIEKIYEQLKGGLKKPIIVESVDESGKKKYTITGQEITHRFTEVLPEVENVRNVSVEDIKLWVAKLSLAFKDTISIFESKSLLGKSCLRFNKSVEYAIAYFLQEATANLLSYAIRDCAKSSKSTISVNNFKHAATSESPFYSLFSNLEASKKLKEYLERFDSYEKNKAYTRSSNTSKVKVNYFKSFVEVEKSTKNMKEIDGKKYWPGMSVAVGDTNFVTYVGKIFDVVKPLSKVKNYSQLRISVRAKEYVSNLMVQFLKSLVAKFDVYKNHICKIEPVIKSGKKDEKKREEEKTISFETLVMILEVMLPSGNETIKTLIDKVCSVKKRLAEVKQSKVKTN